MSNQSGLERSLRPVGYRRTQAGQSLVLALGVMLVLSFLGALFVAVVGSALNSSRQNNRTSSANTFAQAGIDFADKMLQTSPEGADWRPPLQYVVSSFDPSSASATTTKDADNDTYANPCPFNNESQCYAYEASYSQLATINAKDPDKTWLQQGFTRYNVDNGRFLLRLSYVSEPGVADATGTNSSGNITSTSKFIKIESVGFEGVVNSDDPTSYANVDQSRRSELIAYKPITLGDYALFITDKDKRGEVANLGVGSIIPDPTNNPQNVVTPGIYSLTGSGWSSGQPSNPSISQTFLTTTIGSPNTYYSSSSTATAAPGGGGIRCNTDLRLYGLVQVYANPTYGEGIETPGRILFDGFSETTNASTTTSFGTVPYLTEQPTQLQVVTQNSSGAITNALLFPSNATTTSGTTSAFSTLQGLVRDGSGGSDSALYGDGGSEVAGGGYPRSIKRRSPPVIDSADPQTRLTRYQALARVGTGSASETPADTSGPYKATGSYASIYISNPDDIQTESEQFTLRDQWVNKADPQMNGYWRGPLYNPPGALIVAGKVPGTDLWGFTITRSSTQSGAPASWTWVNSDGSVGSRSCNRMRFVYGSNTGNIAQDPNDPIFFLGNADNAPLTSKSTSVPDNQNNDIVIYAEGNVRVRGVISSPLGATDHHVSIVTNGIAYIEGSLLKGRYNSAATAIKSGDAFDASTLPSANSGQVQDPTDPTQYSRTSVAVLAKQYVCVNTTQFTPGAEDFDYNGAGPNIAPSLGDEGYEFANGQSLNVSVLYPRLYADTTGDPTYGSYPYQGYEKLYMSGNGDNGDAYGYVTITNPDSSVNTAQSVAYPPSITTNPIFPSPSGSVQRNSVQGIPYGDYGLGLVDPFVLGFSIDPKQSQADWILHRAVVLPGDIRIEAILYAQDDSFFIIPGDWFNPTTTDTMDTISTRDQSKNDPEFPFYGQPIDLKITIFGSVIENHPASIADQTAWALKWGWIPKFHGEYLYDDSNPGIDGVSPHYSYKGVSNDIATKWSSTASANSIASGLTYLYDPMAGFPVTGIIGGSQATEAPCYIRVDRFGRPLPFAPGLPVSPDLIYSGQQSTQAVSF
jgi:Tfp pilus assembly protein PilX